MILSLGQMPIRTGETDANLEWVRALTREAGLLGADLLLFPEVCLTGFHPASRNQAALARTGKPLAELSALARTHRLALCASYLERNGPQFHIASSLWDSSGDRIAHYRKVHLFSATGERSALSAGERYAAAETRWGKAGLAVCYDLRFPEQFRLLALRGATLFLVAANWPQERMAHWETLLRARAVENLAFAAGANRVGEDGRLRFPGGSMVVGPWGEIAARADDCAGLLTVEIDPADADRARRAMPVLADARAARKRGLA